MLTGQRGLGQRQSIESWLEPRCAHEALIPEVFRFWFLTEISRQILHWPDLLPSRLPRCHPLPRPLHVLAGTWLSLSVERCVARKNKRNCCCGSRTCFVSANRRSDGKETQCASNRDNRTNPRVKQKSLMHGPHMVYAGTACLAFHSDHLCLISGPLATTCYLLHMLSTSQRH